MVPVPKDVRRRIHKVHKCAHTHTHMPKHTTSCAKPGRHGDPALTPLRVHLYFVFCLPSFPSSPHPHGDVHICSCFWLRKGSPPRSEAPTPNPRFSQKSAKTPALAVACDCRVGPVLAALAPSRLKSGLPILGCFLTSPGVYFWVLPKLGELPPHWDAIDPASLF